MDISKSTAKGKKYTAVFYHYKDGKKMKITKIPIYKTAQSKNNQRELE